MADEDANGATLRWRLQTVERTLERKADAKDLEGLARVVREGNAQVNERIDKSDALTASRFDKIEERNEEDRQEARLRQRTLVLTIAGFAVTILAAFLSTGQIG